MTEGNGSVPEHNSKSIKEIRNECAKEMRRINSARKDLNEDAAGVRERLNDNGINVKAFMAALRVSDMEDVTARNNYLDELADSLKDLGMGEQLDFIAHDEAQAAPSEVNEPEAQYAD